MKILVTGGCGFIGTNFIKYLLEEHKDIFIVNLDKLTYASNKELTLLKDKRYKFVQGDITNSELVSSLMYDVDLVFNFAAESHVDNSIHDPGVFINSNVQGTFVLLEAARKCLNLKRFVQISTDEVYGSRKVPAVEETVLNPSSPYSASKASADMLCMAYKKTFGLPIVITRSANNYGPYQHKEKLIPLFITNLLADKQVPIYGNGENVRDWIYVKDNCRAIWLIANKGEYPIYNISGRTKFSNLDITSKLLYFLQKPKSLMNYVPDRLGHDFEYSIDDTRLYMLEYQNNIKRTPFLEGLVTTIEWYKVN
jgi:dTDP-glucose 4,6-dehydratase